MTKKRSYSFNWIKTFWPYVLVGALVLGIVFVGSLDKKNTTSNNVSLGTFAEDTVNISVDQISELYVVADLSDSLGLASSSDVASNYVAATLMYESGQTSAGKIEKPNITNINVSRGVIEYEVKEGENIDTIAARYDASADQIRWSNGLKTVDVAPGTIIKIPSTAGIVYTVKAGDTIDLIVSKYGSNANEIIALNDLEVSGISEGQTIIIKNGNLPITERPEYVAPAPRRTYTNYTYTYTYLGNASSRTNLTCNRSLGAGQCTSWGWLKRPDLGFIKANANRWDDVARANGVLVDHTPAAGTIFQTDSGWYGHVGYVESVNADGSINVSERNYAGCYGVLFSTIPASEVGRFNYIH